MYWSATERGHVVYESRLELANLLLADFDHTIHHIVAQPFSLRAEVCGQVRRHVPDYLWDTDHGPVVVDVVRAERMVHPKIVALCTWTNMIVESIGWSNLVVNEPSVIHLGTRKSTLITIPSVLAQVRGDGLQAGAVTILA